MASSSIILGSSDVQAVSILWLDNRGSEASLEEDLGAAFDSFTSFDIDDPARLGGQIFEWYADNRPTVDVSCPTWPGGEDSNHVLLNCSNPDGEGRPTGELLDPSTGETTPLEYGG